MIYFTRYTLFISSVMISFSLMMMDVVLFFYLFPALFSSCSMLTPSCVQRGAVLATELKNNSNKLAKWTAQSILADADQMLIGFVSRKAPADAFNHTVIGTQMYKPRDFAQQINLGLNNMWGIVKVFPWSTEVEMHIISE